jgi:hypothetical protein
MTMSEQDKVKENKQPAEENAEQLTPSPLLKPACGPCWNARINLERYPPARKTL